MISTSFSSARALVVFATLTLAIQAAPARTEEVIFPVGSRVGRLVPPPGMGRERPRASTGLPTPPRMPLDL